MYRRSLSVVAILSMFATNACGTNPANVQQNVVNREPVNSRGLQYSYAMDLVNAFEPGYSLNLIEQYLGLPDVSSAQTCGQNSQSGSWNCRISDYQFSNGHTLSIRYYFEGGNWYVNGWGWY